MTAGTCSGRPRPSTPFWGPATVAVRRGLLAVCSADATDHARSCRHRDLRSPARRPARGVRGCRPTARPSMTRQRLAPLAATATLPASQPVVRRARLARRLPGLASATVARNSRVPGCVHRRERSTKFPGGRHTGPIAFVICIPPSPHWCGRGGPGTPPPRLGSGARSRPRPWPGSSRIRAVVRASQSYSRSRCQLPSTPSR